MYTHTHNIKHAHANRGSINLALRPGLSDLYASAFFTPSFSPLSLHLSPLAGSIPCPRSVTPELAPPARPASSTQQARHSRLAAVRRDRLGEIYSFFLPLYMYIYFLHRPIYCGLIAEFMVDCICCWFRPIAIFHGHG